MRVRRTLTAGLLATGLTLSLVATPAVAQEEEPAGTASTALTGAEITVTDLLGESAQATLMDLGTRATTDGTPFASTSIVPLRAGDETVGESGASSDGQTRSSSPGGGLGDLAGLLGVSMQPVGTSAEATADSAIATIDAATGRLAALSGVLDLDLATSDVTSLVNPEAATATQGFTVSGLDLALGDLGLGADVLGQLGLDQVLALLSELALDELPEDATDTLDEVLALQDDLQGALGDLDALSTSIDDTLSQLTAIDGVLPDVRALDALLQALNDLLALESPSLADLIDGLDALADLDTYGCGVDTTDLLTIDGAIAAIEDAVECVLAALDDIRTQLVDDGVSGLDGVAPADLLSTLEGTIVPDLLGGLDTDVTDLASLMATITDLADQLVDALGGLDALLDLLPDLLDDAAGLPLVEVDAFDVGFNAIAAETVDASSATVLCQPVDVGVLGEAFATPDCSEGLSAVSDLTSTISDAVGGVTDVLNTLPLDGLVEAGDLRVDLFTNVVESVEEVDGVVTATAGFNLLDLQVPSVTIDPDAVTDPLGDLGLPDVLAPLQDVVNQLDSTLGGLTAITDPVLDGVITTVTDLATQVDSSGTLAALLDEAATLISELSVGDLGTLAEGISTPALSLLVDPVSTAEFTVTTVAAPAPTDPVDPAPEPEDEDPNLPTTGGGLALLGLLALGGAAGLRRRR